MNNPMRRRFLQGLTAGTGLLLLPALRAATAPAVLHGRQFDLEIGELPVNFNGATRMATVVNGQLPAPQLRWREGEDITIRVTNRLAERTSIHWHGLIVPADMDGVPGVSFHGIAPGETFTYRFRVNQSGTYWYHAHSRFQEQTGLYGSIVVEPRGAQRHASDREHVILLSDWTDLDPEAIYRKLKLHAGYFNPAKRTIGDFVADVRSRGLREASADGAMWGQMRMDRTDLADVSGYAYTFLMNGMTPAANWNAAFRRGERVRLRIINGASMTFFDLRIPGLELTIVAADGQDVEPVTVDEFRISPAETYDVIVTPSDDRAYTIFAQAMDRSGYARGTLSPAPGLQAEIPPLDRRADLDMMDMGMAHGAHQAMDHSAHAGHAMPQAPRHAAAEFGPGVDMRVDAPLDRLDDPGVGLRNNGRRVLTYADLHTLDGPIDARGAGREIELHLTGHMERFLWSFNGQKFSEAEPLRFRHGERLRIVLINDTMMYHPIHLHGMWSEVESPDGRFQVRKHTVTVQPAQRMSYLVTADALGRWAYHCHLLYHMEAGMFREVIVAHEEASS
ncbi:copper resistance system multicopper oxidase [Povalibacter sp.]|uniref:copper resistance system multicopper oxidase n=1 Tax=Povalibacter sp. TaxID=1962978 RepID=UPI002F410E63